ncbi:prepilin peptidase [Ralstonia insidiosa]|uniref:Peptidase n=1 Tax=Ralstonia insidiosa TaxID=190721 RepID=A0A192A3F1_9RALS|nr:prepilin peptidase [Ralstonia insidiosa]ANJ74801.1 peptidase [Ralstonia insidiosa]KAB0467297.1 peptidase [Ralstonia insidiosa]MBY4909529.1 prepilin peptidase [Ralstonia insidiosa]
MTSQAEIAGWASVTLLALITIAYDFRSRRVPNWLVAAGLVLSVVLVTCGPIWALAYDWRDVLLGGSIAFACFLPLYVVGWMGAGDVKFFAVAGMLAGWHGLVAVWLISSLLAGVHALVILLLRRMDASEPFAWVVMRMAPALTRWQTGQAGRRGIPYAAYMAIGLLCLQWVPSEMRMPWLPGM